MAKLFTTTAGSIVLLTALVEANQIETLDDTIGPQVMPPEILIQAPFGLRYKV